MKLTKKEFLEKYYPVPAVEMADKSWEECLKHSIRKWWGMRHKISIKSSDHFGSMGHGDTCALCIKDMNMSSIACDSCPIHVYSTRCGSTSPLSPWHKSYDLEKSYPMLKALIQALREVKKNPEKWED